MKLRVMGIVEGSECNGPGRRLVIWTQGCGKACAGCFNPESWSVSGGREWEPVELASWVLSRAPAGLTLTGGDPLEQAPALLAFLRALHVTPSEPMGLAGGIILFTGFRIEEIEAASCAGAWSAKACLKYVDLTIDGRFERSQKIESGLAGSANQRFWFSSRAGRGRCRIGAEVLCGDQQVEVHPGRAWNEVQVTGFPRVNRPELIALGLRVRC